MIRCFAIILLAVFITCARAGAAGLEFCAGYVSRVVPVHATDQTKNLGTDSVFGYQLGGAEASTISGTLNIYAGGDLYSVPFQNVQLILRQKRWLDRRTGEVRWDYVEPESEPLYFRLPSTKTVEAVWVASAGNAATVVNCPTMPITSGPPSGAVWANEKGGNIPESSIRAQAPAAAPPAHLTAHVDTKDCTTVYKDAMATRVVQPQFPIAARGISGTAVIRVLVDSSGKVSDGNIFLTSSNSYLDQEALSSAVKSTYQPAEFLCIAVPGIYQFRANFSP